MIVASIYRMVRRAVAAVRDAINAQNVINAPRNIYLISLSRELSAGARPCVCVCVRTVRQLLRPWIKYF